MRYARLLCDPAYGTNLAQSHYLANIIIVYKIFPISTVLRKKGQSESLMKGQTDFMHSNALGKKGQTA